MFYKYKVGWYNSYDDEEEYSDGLVAANGYGNAAERVIHTYGSDSVFEITLKEIVTDSDDEDYCLSLEELKYTFFNE